MSVCLSGRWHELCNTNDHQSLILRKHSPFGQRTILWMRPSVFVVHLITRKLFTVPGILKSMVTHQQRYPEYNRSSANLLPKRCPRDADHVLGRISHEVRILTIPVSIPAGSHIDTPFLVTRIQRNSSFSATAPGLPGATDTRCELTWHKTKWISSTVVTFLTRDVTKLKLVAGC